MTLWHETDWDELMRFNKDKGEVTEIVSPLIKTLWGQSYSNGRWVDYNAYNYHVKKTSDSCATVIETTIHSISIGDGMDCIIVIG